MEPIHILYLYILCLFKLECTLHEFRDFICLVIYSIPSSLKNDWYEVGTQKVCWVKEWIVKIIEIDHLISIYPATCLRIFQWWFINLLSLKKRKPIFSSVLAIGRSDFTIFSDESIFFLSIIVCRFHKASLDRGALLPSSPYCTY